MFRCKMFLSQTDMSWNFQDQIHVYSQSVLCMLYDLATPLYVLLYVHVPAIRLLLLTLLCRENSKCLWSLVTINVSIYKQLLVFVLVHKVGNTCTTAFLPIQTSLMIGIAAIGKDLHTLFSETLPPSLHSYSLELSLQLLTLPLFLHLIPLSTSLVGLSLVV